MFTRVICSYTTDASAGNVRSSCPNSVDGQLWKAVSVPTTAHTANYDCIVRDEHNIKLAYRTDCDGTAAAINVLPPLSMVGPNCTRGTFSVDIEGAGNSKTGKIYLYFGEPSKFEHVPVETILYFSAVGNETGDAKTTYGVIPGYPPSYIATIESVRVHLASGTAPTTYQAQIWSTTVGTYSTYDDHTYTVWKASSIDAVTNFSVSDCQSIPIFDHTANGRIYGGIKITGSTTNDNYIMIVKTKLQGYQEE